MRRVVTNEIGAATRNGLPPGTCILIELRFLCGVNVVANNAGQHEISTVAVIVFDGEIMQN